MERPGLPRCVRMFRAARGAGCRERERERETENADVATARLVEEFIPFLEVIKGSLSKLYEMVSCFQKTLLHAYMNIHVQKSGM